MITFLTESGCDISQTAYEEDRRKLPLKEMRCSRCGCIGRLIRHACYTRAVKNDGCLVSLTIKRLKCSNCKRTHAVLPSYIVPYSRVTLGEQVQILCQYTQGLGFLAVMEQNADENLSYSILRRYRAHWQEDFAPEDILHLSSEETSRLCFASHHKQFMQVRDIPNSFFAKPT